MIKTQKHRNIDVYGGLGIKLKKKNSTLVKNVNFVTLSLPSSPTLLVEIQALVDTGAIHSRIDAYNMHICLLMQSFSRGLCFVIKLTFYEASCSYLFTLHCGQAKLLKYNDYFPKVGGTNCIPLACNQSMHILSSLLTFVHY